jgi:uncharacterized protein (TIGR02453 family)
MPPAAPAPAPRQPFEGFGPGALDFLAGLAVHQTREWFLANKAIYESQIQRPLSALVEALAFAFAAHDIPLTGDAKRSLFRIHRDVRFSKDKSPYKTNAGATLTRDGAKMAPGMLYIQVGGAEGSFMAVGFYGPEPRDLQAIRAAIAADPGRWLGLEAALAKAGHTFTMADAVTRLPRGFETLTTSPAARALKRRNFIVSRPIPPPRLVEADLAEDILGFVVATRPLLDFGWRAIDRGGGNPQPEAMS